MQPPRTLRQILLTTLLAALLLPTMGQTTALTPIDTSTHRIHLGRLPGAPSSWPVDTYRWLVGEEKVVYRGDTTRAGSVGITRQPGQTRYRLETSSFKMEYEIADACWALDEEAFQGCIKPLTPLPTDWWKEVDTHRNVREQAENERKEEQRRYDRAVAANEDEFAWLGTLPQHWRNPGINFSEISQKLRVFDQMDVNVLKFTCRSPEQIGPVPHQAAVTRYLRSAQQVRTWLFTRELAFQGKVSWDAKTQYLEAQKLWSDLLLAAQHGNWMAVFLATRALSKTQSADPIVSARISQLQGWMIRHEVADFYLDESGLFDLPYPSDKATRLFNYLALNGSYTAMLHAGTLLKNAADPGKQTIGRRMHECVRRMAPSLPTQF
ncbi:hypothetical protein G7047_09365 [Diaphorobacter sp. HDW4A]|uniref:hypothetical protein n=1 Tax=Diaphorobacter sp. HDW4A TaxID=2714924 RepID=UPI00140B5DA5|nr:hypothetical protein [Diaphorobacter sp. HDW4A]QIL80086.1 hypothetical protein G7047_09365 [Diaphorobacter sp. HDW4A]